jgi:hypothetical protein
MTTTPENIKICEKCLELAKAIDALNLQIQALTTENTKLNIVLRDNNLADELSQVSDTEAICLEQIQRLKQLSTGKKFTQEDAKILDLLHINLLRTREGKIGKDSGKKTKKLSNSELLKLVKD